MNRFGEHFYRMVVFGFYPSVETLIVHAAVLLDPSTENLYFATTIWYKIVYSQDEAMKPFLILQVLDRRLHLHREVSSFAGKCRNQG